MSDWVGGSGYRENGGREQGSEEHRASRQGSKENLLDTLKWSWGRVACRVLRRHNFTCHGRNDCARKLFGEIEIGDAPNDAHMQPKSD